MILRHRLVPDLSGGKRHSAKGRPARGLGSLYRQRFGKFLWRGRLRLSDQARLVAWRVPEGAGCVRRIRPVAAHPTVFTFKLWAIIALFALATFSYAAFSTIANVLPSDLFKSASVASVSGMSGSGAGIGTIVAFKLIGYFSDARQTAGAHSFDAIVIFAGMIPFLSMMLVLLLVRNSQATEEGPVRRI